MAEGVHRGNIVRDLGCRTLGLLHPRDFVVSTTDNSSFIQRMQLHSKLPVHTGCVNSIWWSDDGEHILSGSDDTLLCITNAWTGKVVTSIRSGHRANIFSAKFMPGSGLGRVVSCSGDGILYYTDVEREETWGANCFNCHYGTAYELLTLDSDPNTFLSCGEDGTVRWFDMRLKTSCTKDNCKDDILIKAHRAVTAIAANPHTPYHLAVGCSDSSVRLFDRRMLGTKGSGGVCGKGTLGVFCRFCPPPLTNKSCRVTSLQYSGDGQDLLVSYSSDYIYLFSPAHLVSDGEGGMKYEETSNGYSKCPGQSSRDPPVKRLRLRGDWSDTGPQSRPESERDTRASTVADESESPQRSLMQRMTDMLQRWLEDPASFRQSMQPPQARGQDSSPSSDSSTSQTTAETSSPSRPEADSTAEAVPHEDSTGSRKQSADQGSQPEGAAAETGGTESAASESLAEGTAASKSPASEIGATAAADGATGELSGHREETHQDVKDKETETTGSKMEKNSSEPISSKESKDVRKKAAGVSKDEKKKEKTGSESLGKSKAEMPEKKDTKDSKEKKDTEATKVLEEDAGKVTSPACKIEVVKVKVVDTSTLPAESEAEAGVKTETDRAKSADSAKESGKLTKDVTNDNSDKGETVESPEGQIEQGAVGGGHKGTSGEGWVKKLDLKEKQDRDVSQEVVRPKTGSQPSQTAAGDDGRNSPPPTSESTPPTPQSDEPIPSGDSSDDEETSQPEERADRPMYARLQALMKMRRQQREKEETELSQLPCPPHKMIYRGHRNARTMIKESNFFGSQYVISGSDCGHVFIWDRYTGKLVTLFEADKHVVNCVQPHPTYPVLATSGIDYDVKLWMAMAEEATFPEEAHEIMHRNETMLEETRDTITVPASFMLRMLASLNHIRSEQDSQPAGEERRPSDE